MISFFGETKSKESAVAVMISQNIFRFEQISESLDPNAPTATL